MENNFTNEEFEHFLRQSSDGFRMRPSDKVWKGISKNINPNRRRFGVFLGIALLITSFGSYYFINTFVSTRNNITPPNTSGQATETKLSHAAPSGNQLQNSELSVVNNSSPEILTTVSNVRVHSKANITEINSSKQPEVVTNKIHPSEFKATIADDTYPQKSIDQKSLNKDMSSVSQQTVNNDLLTIESVVNTYKSKKAKLGLQLYFTPTVSYRQLSENKAYLRTVLPMNVPYPQQSLYDINSAVTHKPDFGFEVGLAAKYPVNKYLKLRGGLQFNVNGYDIKVFNSSTQVATIRLNDRNRVDSFNTSTTYSNTSGYKSNWLKNFYFQVSVPVGVEFTLKGASEDDVRFGIASTIQPTYVLGDRAYLISSDYKNYVEVPWLIRRWNVNTNLETFVAYSTGQVKWQVGPQVRYQLLSSFVKKYPVKENLFDFGLKVGISLNNQ